MSSDLPLSVVEQDCALAEQVEQSTVALWSLRWHWTLDESNPERVSIREYARQVGRNESVIRADVRAHEKLQECGGTPAPGRTLDDIRELARMSEQRALATELIADRLKIPVQTAKKQYRPAIENGIAAARIQAEMKGTTYETEVPETVASAVAHHKSKQAAVSGQKSKGGGRNRLAAYEATFTSALRKARDLLSMADQDMVGHAAEMQPRFIEMAEQGVQIYTALVERWRGGDEIVGTAWDVEPPLPDAVADGGLVPYKWHKGGNGVAYEKIGTVGLEAMVQDKNGVLWTVEWVDRKPSGEVYQVVVTERGAGPRYHVDGSLRVKVVKRGWPELEAGAEE